MTDCQRCGGHLKYVIATYTGDGDLLGTIEKQCEPCIAHEVRRLNQILDTPDSYYSPPGLFGCIWGLLLILGPWATIAAIIYIIYNAIR